MRACVRMCVRICVCVYTAPLLIRNFVSLLSPKSLTKVARYFSSFSTGEFEIIYLYPGHFIFIYAAVGKHSKYESHNHTEATKNLLNDCLAAEIALPRVQINNNFNSAKNNCVHLFSRHAI